ncbi:MAG: hypothetical protein AMJ65_05280 [Phycisphaerae bacterium SG8_4]|nr:MAG: hypothetical protein AMJ65_05280 [Phycisphaerae bacterium SG8_4]
MILALRSAAEQAKADFFFGEATQVPNVNSSCEDVEPYVSADGLELYFRSDRPPQTGPIHDEMRVSKRSGIDETWPVPVKLDPPVNSEWPESAPCIFADALELHSSDGWSGISVYPPNPEGYGGGDLWVSTRAAEQDQ